MSRFRLTCFALVLQLVTATFARADERVAVRPIGETLATPDWIFVITHGMGGTTKGDRFEQLATAIKAAHPDANVYLVDWTKDAKVGIFPFVVARAIPDVAASGAAILHGLKVNPQKVTMIGESFGNNVNVQIAAHLGKVARMLALNPANELGGGGRIDLTQHCDQGWSFHSHSAFDTHQAISHRGVLLHTPRDFTPSAQHTYGAQWLCDTVQNGDADWLSLSEDIPAGPQGMFDVAILTDGKLDWELVPRRGHMPTADVAANH